MNILMNPEKVDDYFGYFVEGERKQLILSK